MNKARPQINMRVDEAFQAAIDEVRASRRPVPTVSELIRQLVQEALERRQQPHSQQGSPAGLVVELGDDERAALGWARKALDVPTDAEALVELAWIGYESLRDRKP